MTGHLNPARETYSTAKQANTYFKTCCCNDIAVTEEHIVFEVLTFTLQIPKSVRDTAVL